MSLKPGPIGPVPGETARVARAAFRKGNPLLKLRDELGAIFADADFADLFPRRGQPGLAPWRLALVTLLQFREDLADRRAAGSAATPPACWPRCACSTASSWSAKPCARP